jgi:hypothetical protein
MPAIHLLVVRDGGETTTLTPTMVQLLIALLALVLVAILSIIVLFVLRNIRNQRKRRDSLPEYEEKPSTRTSNHRRLTITATPFGRKPESLYVYQEKQTLVNNSSSPPPSPIPEIRITFPEEVDEAGKRQSGRVVVVRVGEHSVGLEPLQEDLPPYEKESGERFQSLDLDRIGGLKEKDLEKQWS